MSIVTIEGSILLPNGQGPTSGQLLAALSTNASISGDKVLASKRFDIPDGGNLASASPVVQLQANDGLSPANSFYSVDYLLRDSKGAVHAFRELWQLSGSGTQQIGDITVISVPLALIIGSIPLSGADYPENPTPTVAYRGAMRRRKRANRAEEAAICLGNHDLTAFKWSGFADGQP